MSIRLNFQYHRPSHNGDKVNKQRHGKAQEPGMRTGPSTPSSIFDSNLRSHEGPVDKHDLVDNSTTLIRQELESNSNLPASRMRALEHALTIVKVFATASHQGYHAQHDENEYRDASTVDNIPPELHYATIHGRPTVSILLSEVAS